MKNKGILWIAAGLLLLMLGGCGAKQEDKGSLPAADSPAGVGTTAPSSSGQPESVTPAETLPGTPLTEWDAVAMWSGSLIFSVYNGQTLRSCYQYSDYGKIVDSLRETPGRAATDFTVDKLTYPVYCLELPTKDGMNLHMLWTNGYLLTREGKTYHFSYDFDSLASLGKIKWDEERVQEEAGISDLYVSRYLLEQAGQWRFDYMTKTRVSLSPEVVEMAVKERSNSDYPVVLSNHSEIELLYGRGFHLEVWDGADWYYVSASPLRNYAFTLEGYALEAGGTGEMDHSLTMYGKLPPGHYRLVKNILEMQGSKRYYAAAEFDIGKEEAALWDNPYAAQSDAMTPTGYPQGEIQRILLYWNERIYTPAGEKVDKLSVVAVPLGIVGTVDNKQLPNKNMMATQLPLGTEVYRIPNVEGLFVKVSEDWIVRLTEWDESSMGKLEDWAP